MTRSALTFIFGFLLATQAAAAEDRPRLELARAGEAPAIDGNLDDAIWQQPALALSDWLTYNPLNGEKLAQQTEVHAAYDERYLYFAFHCSDPEPQKVRGSLSRRDSLWQDDWVGLSLDSVLVRSFRESPRRAGGHPDHAQRG